MSAHAAFTSARARPLWTGGAAPPAERRRGRAPAAIQMQNVLWGTGAGRGAAAGEAPTLGGVAEGCSCLRPTVRARHACGCCCRRSSIDGTPRAAEGGRAGDATAGRDGGCAGVAHRPAGHCATTLFDAAAVPSLRLARGTSCRETSGVDAAAPPSSGQCCDSSVGSDCVREEQCACVRLLVWRGEQRLSPSGLQEAASAASLTEDVLGGVAGAAAN